MDLSKPSKSTIDSIMQYNIFVQTKATKYGKYAETKAFACYLEKQ